MPLMNRAEEDILVRKAKEGDGRAIAALIQHHQEPLYSFMLRMSGRPEVAGDIVQEAFVRVLKNVDRFDSRFRFSTWLFTIAKRLYMNAVQKYKPVYDSDHVEAQMGEFDAPGFQSANDEKKDNVAFVPVPLFSYLRRSFRFLPSVFISFPLKVEIGVQG